MSSGCVKPFQRRKDGRSAWLAIHAQCAGIDKWEKMLKEQDELLHTRKWKGTGNFPLERFVARHQNAHALTQQCAEHVDCQLPSQNARVKFLLDNIESSNSELRASIALVRNDEGTTGEMNKFEDAVAFIVPADPVAKREQQRKHSEAEVSTAETKKDKKKVKFDEDVETSSTTVRVGKGKSGVELRHCKEKEHEKLSEAQKQELSEWRRKNNPGKDPPKSETSIDKRTIAAMITDQLKSALSSVTNANKEDAEEKTVKIGSANADKGANEPPKSKRTSSVLKGVPRKIR